RQALHYAPTTTANTRALVLNRHRRSGVGIHHLKAHSVPRLIHTPTNRPPTWQDRVSDQLRHHHFHALPPTNPPRTRREHQRLARAAYGRRFTRKQPTTLPGISG